MESYIDREEVAKRLSLPPSTIDYLRREKGLPSFKIGKHNRYLFREVESWFKDKRDN